MKAAYDNDGDEEQATIVSVRAFQADACGPSTSTSRGQGVLRAGQEHDFIVAWGRSNAALQSKERSLLVAWGICGMLLAWVCVLAWWGRQERTTVFVRDSASGHLVQADREALSRAGAQRVPEEFTAFVREWVVDCFTWTPVDVEDR